MSMSTCRFTSSSSLGYRQNTTLLHYMYNVGTTQATDRSGRLYGGMNEWQRN